MIACSSHAFSSTSHRRKIYEEESHAEEAFPSLPRLCLLITPYEYICVHMHIRIHIHRCTQKKGLSQGDSCVLPSRAKNHHAWAQVLRKGRSQGRRQAAGLVIQRDHNSTCWILWGKCSRGVKLALLGMEREEDRQEALAHPGTVCLQVLRQSWPYRSCIHRHGGSCSPSPSEGNCIHCLCIFILLQRYQCLSQAGTITQDEHDSRATGPQVAKCIVKANFTNTQQLKILHFQHLEAVCKFFTDRKKIQLHQ